MKKTLVLKGLLLSVSLGEVGPEKKSLKPFRLDIRLVLLNRYRSRKDALNEVVDYQMLHSQVSQLLTSKHFNLQETAVQEVMDLCFGMDERVTAVEVSAARTSAFLDCEEVGLEYEMERSDWLLDRNPLGADS